MLIFTVTFSVALMPILAVVHPTCFDRTAQTLTCRDAVARFLRERENYPLFAKPIDGKYSISVITADAYVAAADEVRLHDGDRIPPAILAEQLTSREAGYLL